MIDETVNSPKQEPQQGTTTTTNEGEIPFREKTSTYKSLYNAS